MSGPLAPLLIELLVCPEDRQPLLYVPQHDVLYNDRLHRIYAVIEGIPDLLIEDATTATDEQHATFLASPGSVRTGSPASGSPSSAPTMRRAWPADG